MLSESYARSPGGNIQEGAWACVRSNLSSLICLEGDQTWGFRRMWIVLFLTFLDLNLPLFSIEDNFSYVLFSNSSTWLPIRNLLGSFSNPDSQAHSRPIMWKSLRVGPGTSTFKSSWVMSTCITALNRLNLRAPLNHLGILKAMPNPPLF